MKFNPNPAVINKLNQSYEQYKKIYGSNKSKFDYIKYQLAILNQVENINNSINYQKFKGDQNNEQIKFDNTLNSFLDELTDSDTEDDEEVLNKSEEFDLNDSLLKELIDVDFPYVKSSWKENKLNSIDLRINVKKYDYYNILNLYTLNTNIKQFIRTLQYLSTNEECHIYFWSNNNFVLKIIQLFAKEYSLEHVIFSGKQFPVIPVVSDPDNPPVRFLFILEDPFLTRASRIIKKKICNSDFFLVNHFTFFHRRDTFGMYEIKNDLSDYKKIIVLLSIIDSILNSENDKNYEKDDKNEEETINLDNKDN
jgi:hypothetical protein